MKLKELLLLLITISITYPYSESTHFLYKGWPESDSTITGYTEITTDTVTIERQNSIHVLYAVDISELKSSNLRKELIDGGKRILSSLRSDDRFGIVTYSDRARVELSLTNMTPTNKQRAADILEIISTGRGRDMEKLVETVNKEFLNASFDRSAVRYLILSNTGDVTSGSSGIDVLTAREGVRGSLNYIIHTVGYGETFNEDLLLSISKNSNGLASWIPTNKFGNFAQVFGNIVRDINTPLLKDIEVFFDFPDSDIKVLTLNNEQYENKLYHLKYLSGSRKHRLFFDLTNRPDRISAVDIDFKGVTIPRPGMTVTIFGGDRIPVSSKPIYNSDAAPHLLRYEIVRYLLKELEILEGNKQQLSKKELGNKRRKLASNLRSKYIRELRVLNNKIQSDEITRLLENTQTMYQDLRSEVYSLNWLLKRYKYHLNNMISNP